MENEVNLLEVIQSISKNDDEVFSVTCKVIEVDESNETCNVEPLNGDADILDVKLSSGKSSNSNIYIPVVGSFVLVSFISNSSAFVSMFSELSTVKIRGDEFGGLIKIEELKENLDIMTSRIDTLYKAIKDGTTTSQDGGASYKTTMGLILDTQLDTEDFSKIENESVKHG